MTIEWEPGPTVPGGRSNVLDPSATQAADAAGLLKVMFVQEAIVIAVVLGHVVISFIRSRRVRGRSAPRTAGGTDDRRSLRLVVVGGIVAPVLAATGIFLATVGPLGRLDDHSGDALQIEVTGHRWWWDVTYPDAGFRTANEIHVPVDHDAVILIRSADVIHSVWIPELAGKVDAVPGKTNRLVLHPTRLGTFDGRCGEFCGLEHARMRFTVVVEPEHDFEKFVERQRRAPPVPSGDELEGQEVFLSSACVYCHRVEGTNATSTYGPDLTHLASRRTLGAGTLPNTRGNLAGWILDPQSAKPGNLMPPMDLSGPELQALLDYLQGLH